MSRETQEAEARKREEILLNQAKEHYEKLPAEIQDEIKMTALSGMSETLRNQVLRQGPGWKMTLDFAIKKVVLERLSKEAASRETQD